MGAFGSRIVCDRLFVGVYGILGAERSTGNIESLQRESRQAQPRRAGMNLEEGVCVWRGRHPHETGRREQ